MSGQDGALSFTASVIILTSETSPSISRDIPSDPAKHNQSEIQVIRGLTVGAAQTNGCVISAETQPMGENAANTRLIRRLMMDSAAKTLSPTAESSMIHHAPRLFLSLLLFLASPCPLRVV